MIDHFGLEEYQIHVEEAVDVTCDKSTFHYTQTYRESMAGSIIQATGMVEFEDSLITSGVLPGDCWCHCGDCIKPWINSNTVLGSMLVLGAF